MTNVPDADRQKVWQEVATPIKRGWCDSPQGQARLAKHAGQTWFQVAIPIQETARSIRSQTFGSVQTETTAQHEQGAVLDEIEAEGFDLVNAGWIFQETGSISRDKLLSSGQSSKVEGQVLGIYLFRANAQPPNPDTEPWRAAAEAAFHEAVAT